MVFSKNNSWPLNSWVLITLGIAIYFFTKEYDAIGDFQIFFQAGNGLTIEENIYTTPYLNWLYYFYSPFFALVLSWFSSIPLLYVAWGWKVINLIAFFRLFFLLKAYLPEELSDKTLNRIFLGVFALSIAPIYRCIHLLQFNLIMFWGILEAFKLFKEKKWLLGGVIFGFVCSTKLIPLTIIPYLIYRKEFKGALSCLGFSLFFLLLPSVFIGHSYNVSLLESWWHVINPSKEGNIVALIETEKQFVSIPTLVPVWFTESEYADTNFKFSRHLFDLSPSVVKYTIMFLQVSLIALMLFFLRSRPFVKAKNRIHELWEISYLLFVTIMIAPRQQVYAFVFIIPACLYFVYVLVELKKQNKKGFYVLLSLLIVIGILMNLEFYVGDFRKLYSYIKTLGIGALLLLIPFLWYTPKRLNLR